jgi:hypothetical protein
LSDRRNCTVDVMTSRRRCARARGTPLMDRGLRDRLTWFGLATDGYALATDEALLLEAEPGTGRVPFLDRLDVRIEVERAVRRYRACRRPGHLPRRRRPPRGTPASTSPPSAWSGSSCWPPAWCWWSSGSPAPRPPACGASAAACRPARFCPPASAVHHPKPHHHANRYLTDRRCSAALLGLAEHARRQVTDQGRRPGPGHTRSTARPR